MPFLSVFKRKGLNGLGFSTTAEEATEGLDLTGKRVLITGVNSGIGLETAEVMSARGAYVLGLSRTQAKSDSISHLMNNNYIPLECELSEPDSIVSCVDIIKSSGHKIDIIICNAGIMAVPDLTIKYGLELQFLTNHIGHFILVNSLIDLLNEKARIVVVSSVAHKVLAPSEGIEFGNFSGENSYDPHRAYGHSKLANILFSNEFSQKYSSYGLTSNAVHPGVIRTNLLRNYNHFMRHGARLVEGLFFKNVHQGAATQCYVGTNPAIEGVTGKYFVDCNLSNPSDNAKDSVMAARLWEESEYIAENTFGIKFDRQIGSDRKTY